MTTEKENQSVKDSLGEDVNVHEDVQKIERQYSVMMIITNKSGVVLYAETVGGEALYTLLEELSTIPGYPVERQKLIINNIGQNMFYLTNSDFLESISGTFIHLGAKNTKELLTKHIKDEILNDEVQINFVSTI